MDTQLFLFLAAAIPAVVLAGVASWYGERLERMRWQSFVPAGKEQIAGVR
jgi:hypothetical protein